MRLDVAARVNLLQTIRLLLAAQFRTTNEHIKLTDVRVLSVSEFMAKNSVDNAVHRSFQESMVASNF
jgi:hypothetical protein